MRKVEGHETEGAKALGSMTNRTPYRMGYSVTELKPWRWKRKYTGWVWMVLDRKPNGG